MSNVIVLRRFVPRRPDPEPPASRLVRVPVKRIEVAA